MGVPHPVQYAASLYADYGIKIHSTRATRTKLQAEEYSHSSSRLYYEVILHHDEI